MIRSFTEQLRRHSVALISLVVAISSLGYNTWRNEVTEANRNIRAAGFQLINELAELDLVVFYAYFERQPQRGKEGWARVLAAQDLGELLPERVRLATVALHAIWARESAPMIEEHREESWRAIDAAIEDTRGAVREALRELH